MIQISLKVISEAAHRRWLVISISHTCLDTPIMFLGHVGFISEMIVYALKTASIELADLGFTSAGLHAQILWVVPTSKGAIWWSVDSGSAQRLVALVAVVATEVPNTVPVLATACVTLFFAADIVAFGI